jgi:hypothetical protein
MTAEDRTAFEIELQNNTELQQELKLYQAIEQQMQQSTVGNESALRNTLGSYQQEYFGKAKVVNLQSKGKVRKMIFTAAAVAAVLAVVFLLLPTNTGKQSSADLYASNYTPEKASEITRGDADTAFTEAAKLFDNKKYTTALSKLQAIASTDARAQLLLAMSHSELKQNEVAIGMYDKVINGGSILVEKAKWYKAMHYLKNDQRAECATTLETIAKDSDYFSRAEKLIKQLK